MFASFVAAVVLAGCVEGEQFLSIPPGMQAAIVVIGGADGAWAALPFGDNVRLAPEREAEAHLLLFRDTLDELQIPTGDLDFPAEDQPSRALPPPDATYRSEDHDGTQVWFELPALPAALAMRRLPQSTRALVQRCADSGGCWDRTGEAGRCRIPCPGNTPPTPPEAPVAPASPALPVFAPCPADWSAQRDHTVQYCAPPVRTAIPDCPAGAAPFGVDAVCAQIGSVCPAGDFPEVTPTNSVFVLPGERAAPDGTRANPFSTIGAAIQAAPSGATIVVGKGDFEVAAFVDKPLDVLGACPQATILRAPGEHAALTFLSGTSANIRNLTFTGRVAAVADPPGQIAVTFEDIVLTQTVAVHPCLIANGAGLDLTIRNAVIDDCTSGGVAVRFGARVSLDRVTFRGAGAFAVASQIDARVDAEEVLTLDQRPTNLGVFDIRDFGALSLRRARLEGGRAGILLADSATATVADSAFGSVEIAFRITGSRARIDRTVIREAKTALEAFGADVALDQVTVTATGSAEAGFKVMDRSRVLASRVRVAGTLNATSVAPSAALRLTDALFGRRLGPRSCPLPKIESAGDLQLERVASEGLVNLSSTNDLVARDLSAIDNGTPTDPCAAALVLSGRADLDRVALDFPFGNLTILGGGEVHLRNLRSSGGQRGREGAILVQGGSHLFLDRAAIATVGLGAFSVREESLLVANDITAVGSGDLEAATLAVTKLAGHLEGSRWELSGTSRALTCSDGSAAITDLRSTVSDYAVVGDDGCALSLARADITGAFEGILAQTGSNILASEIVIHRVRPMSDGGTGQAVTVNANARAHLQSFALEDNQVGLRVDEAASIDLAEGVISGNEIGASVPLAFDYLPLAPRVRFANQRNFVERNQ